MSLYADVEGHTVGGGTILPNIVQTACMPDIVLVDMPAGQSGYWSWPSASSQILTLPIKGKKKVTPH